MDAIEMHRRTYVIIAALAVVVAGGGIAWGATASDDSPETSGARPKTSSTPKSTQSQVPVIVPGRPGASAAVVPQDQITAPDGSRYGTLDVWFVRMMIQHHGQAVEMARLAPSRAGKAQVKAIADRIVVAQGPEIEVLRAWLKERKLGESAGAGAEHQHGTMRGMASPQAISALTKATGAAFDRSFVDLMSAHHQGAIDMCSDVLKVGVNERIQELATNIAVEQQIEITRMRDVVGS